MCGIAGIVASDGLRPNEAAALPDMLRLLEHRGPDGSGTFESSHAALGHRRLAIIDPAGAKQPIANEDGRLHLVLNGEIYNYRELRKNLESRGHRFATNGDAETVVHLYEEHGDDCVRHLRGMFAFALWDEPRRRLLLVRDRLGEKPLYYAEDGRRIVFGSEIKPLLAAGVRRGVNAAALLDYFSFGFIAAPQTIFQAVRKLQAGERVVYENGRVQGSAYWDLPESNCLNLSADALSSALLAELDVAARLRMIADVPLGVLLSGGVDSAAVAAAATRTTNFPPRAFSVGFDEPGFDERGAAAAAATALGATHAAALVRPDFDDALDELGWHFDEPFAAASALPMMYLAGFARRQVTVALSGDGGDEVLAGYRRYRFDLLEQRLRFGAPAFLRRPLLGALATIAPRSQRWPRWMRGAATLRNLSTDAAAAHALSLSRLRPDELARLISPALAAEAGDYDPFERPRSLYRACRMSDHLSRCQYVDLRFELADGILTKVDRASMACGLEVRSPLLDHRFVEFAFRLPPPLRIQRGVGKVLLRRSLIPVLGREAAMRPKHGFEVPIATWFRHDLRPLFEREVLSESSSVAAWTQAGEVRRLWGEHQSGRFDHAAVLWALLMLARWSDRVLRADLRSPPGPDRALRPSRPVKATV